MIDNPYLNANKEAFGATKHKHVPTHTGYGPFEQGRHVFRDLEKVNLKSASVKMEPDWQLVSSCLSTQNEYET